jgi:hypothetical protein
MCILAGCNRNDNIEIDAVKKTVSNFYEGWYSGDSIKFESALDANYTNSRINEMPVDNSSGTNNDVLNNVGNLGSMNNDVEAEKSIIKIEKREMVKMAKLGGGKNRPKNYVNMKIQVLDIQDNIASIMMVSDYIDYMQLIKINGKWLILNGLYDVNKEFKKPTD